MAIDGQDQYWMNAYWVSPISRPAIDAWRKYYDDMETLDRRYRHAPSYRNRSRSVYPVMASIHVRNRRHRETKEIKDHLELTLGGAENTKSWHIAQDIALQEHERDLEWCECQVCVSCR